jgi:two-component system chemotaxis response regulator CheB
MAMILFCEECGEKYDIRPEELLSENRPARCENCDETITPAIIPLQKNKTSVSKVISYGCSVQLHNQKLFKVLIVDDSKVFRKILRGMLNSEKRISILAEAEDGVQALELIPKLKPDVVTLDVNMPVMDGLKTLKHLMIKHPVPTIMLSSFTKEGASLTFDTLRYGAVDFMQKPSRLQMCDLQAQQKAIIEKVIHAATAEIDRFRFLRPAVGNFSTSTRKHQALTHVCGIGVAEGGYGTLLKIIPFLSSEVSMAIVIVFYTTEDIYMDAFVNYLGRHSAVNVKRAFDGQTVENGTCYLTSGKEYVTFEKITNQLVMHLNPSPFYPRRGAVNMMMTSLAEKLGQAATGVVLTGKGDDGAEGISEIVRQGGSAIVQNLRTCLYKEMPVSVLENCSESKVVSDSKMADQINRIFK